MRFVYAVQSIFVCTALFSVTSQAQGEEYKLNIRASDAVTALNALAVQTQHPLLFDYDQVKSIHVSPLRGTYTLQDALDLILKDTGLVGSLTGGEVISIFPDSKRLNQAKEDQMIFKGKNKALLSGAAAALMASIGANAVAQVEPLDEVITTGTLGSRGKPRSSLTSPVAVDSINADDLVGTGATETGRILQELVPSFNFSSSSISDGTDSLRPATLRGLGPDQTLVLVNGKRRHKSALIHVNTSVGRGSAGTDINAIPVSALKNIEVLRDGASALYGSDAISGVINFQLKDASSGGTITATAGQTYESDGTTYNLSVNKGLGLGENGFLNLTYEYNNRENTNRAGLSGECQYICVTDEDTGDQVADDSTVDRERAFDRQNFRIGDSDSEGHIFFANLGYELSDTADLYAFGNYGTRKNESAGFYRRANEGSKTLLAIYPDGFLPLIRPSIKDTSLASGINWELSDNLKLDTSVGFGKNAYNFEIANSINASLGNSSPTVFDAGTLELSEWLANADLVYDLDKYVIAAGLGFRKENYKLLAGEPDSYVDGGFVNVDTFNTPPLFGPTDGAAGAQVFRGFSPANAVNESRDSFSGYAELSADITDRINGQAAVRYEDYDGFGGTFTWKLAALAEVTDWASVRGSISTGFRAPSMQQLYFNSTSTQFVVDEATGELVAEERGTFRNDSALAQDLGIPELQEETSLSWGLGAIFQPFEGASLTVDYYSIDIDDRIMITGGIDRELLTGEDQADALAAFDAAGATEAQFFINGVNTETTGVDIIAAYKLPNPVAGGDLKLTIAANFTSTDVVSEVPAPGLLTGLDLITAQDVSILEEWQPKSRINLGANWSNDHWRFDVQGSRYGEYTVCEGGCDPTNATETQTFGKKWLADMQVDYKFDSGVTLSVGGNNIFDTTPDRNLIGQSRAGRIVDSVGNLIAESDGVFEFSRRSAPFGFNGGYYYGRVSIDF